MRPMVTMRSAISIARQNHPDLSTTLIFAVHMIINKSFCDGLCLV
jgi:hypothetical protein